MCFLGFMTLSKSKWVILCQSLIFRHDGRIKSDIQRGIIFTENYSHRYIDNPSVNKRSEQKCMTDLTNILNCSLTINARVKLYRKGFYYLNRFNIAADSCNFLKKQFLDRLIITCPGVYDISYF